MNILVVDDEFFIVQGVEKALKSILPGEHQVFSAYSAEQARRVFQKTAVDLLITDIEMPMENGFELIRWVKEQNYKSIIIILTGHQRFDYAKEALEYHCFNYLIKPVDRQLLKKVVNAAFEEKRQGEGYYSFQKAQEPEKASDGEVRKYSRGNEIIVRVREYIVEHLSDSGLSRDAIADEVHLTPEYLSYLFKKEFGTTLTDYIMMVRMDHAKEALRNTNLSIDDVAQDSGFANTTYFFKKFKDYVGMTPRKYRNEG